MLSAATGLASAIVMQFALARQLGPEAFGVYCLVISIQHFAMIGQDGGFRVLLMRETVRPSAGSDSPTESGILAYAGGHIAVVTVLALVVALAIAGTAFWVPVLFAVLGGGAKTFTSFVSAIMIGRSAFRREALWQMAGRLVVTGAGIAVAAAGYGAGAVLFALFVAQCVCLLPVFHSIDIPQLRIGWPRAISFHAGKMMLLALLTALYFRSGALFLFLISTDLGTVARFSLMHRVLDAALFMIAPLAQIVFVRSRASKGPFAANRNMLLFAVVWVGVGCIGAVLGFLIGRPMIAFAAGETYREAGALAGWFALALTAAGPNFVLMQTLLARECENVVLVSAAMAVAAASIANLILVPTFGAAGAAAAIVCAETMQLTLLFVAVHRETKGMTWTV